MKASIKQHIGKPVNKKIKKYDKNFIFCLDKLWKIGYKHLCN